MSTQFLISLCALTALGVSYYARRRISLPLIPFSFLWCLLLTTYIWALSIGLLQVHFDCPFLWGECYAEGYPYWIMTATPLLLWSPAFWCLIALPYCMRNFWICIENK